MSKKEIIKQIVQESVRYKNLDKIDLHLGELSHRIKMSDSKGIEYHTKVLKNLGVSVTHNEKEKYIEASKRNDSEFPKRITWK